MGRDEAAEQLGAMIGRGVLTTVHGLGGVGKTSLVRHVLASRFRPRFLRALLIDVQEGALLEELCVELIEAVAASTGVDKLSWQGGLADADAMLAAALDLVAQGDATVVLDDVHHLDRASELRLLRTIQHYGRGGRWIAMGRRDPQLPEMLGQKLTIGALPEQVCMELARSWRPDLEQPALQQAVTRSGGSPWRLRQVVAGADPSLPSGRGMLDGLDDDVRRVVVLLVALKRPVQAEVLRSIGLEAVEAALEQLQERDLVKRTGAGVRLHELARTTLQSEVPQVAELAQRAVAILGESDSPALQLEALALLFESDPTRAVQQLTAAMNPLLDAGLAPRIWTMLSDHPEQANDARLLCAAELANAEALSWASHQPRPSQLQARLAWVQTLFLVGPQRRASEEAQALAKAANHAAAVTIEAEARLLAARSAMLRAAHSDAAHWLTPLVSQPGEIGTRARALQAWACVGAGDLAKALQLVDGIADEMPHLSARGFAQAQQDRMLVLTSAGQLARASSLAQANELDATNGNVFVRAYAMRDAVGRAYRAAERGELLVARRWLERLGDTSRLGPTQQVLARLCELRLAVATGDMHNIRDILRDVVISTRLAANADMAQWALVGHGYVRAILGAQVEPPAEIHTQVPALQAALIDLFDHLAAARAGRPQPPQVSPLLDRLADNIEAVVVLRETCASMIALTRGDSEEAIRLATQARDRAAQHELVLMQADALMALCDALCTAGQWEPLAREANALHVLAQSAPSERLRMEAAFHTAATSKLDPVQLEQCARQDARGPAAKRRARAMLCGVTPEDRIDAAVVEAIATRQPALALRNISPQPQQPWRPGWGLDHSEQRVWLPDGSTLSLRGSLVAWRLLCALADAGGALDKESLAQRVWPNERYHPLRHDGRLQVAVRRLRKRLEIAPDTPQRIVTIENGYSFGTKEPVRELRVTGHDSSA